MIAELIQLTLRGTIAFLLVLGLDTLLARRMRAQGRKYWWIVVGLAFLVPFKLPVLPGLSLPANARPLGEFMAMGSSLPSPSLMNAVVPLGIIWGLGALFSLALIVWQTTATARRLGGVRFCTDPALLDILEDSKREAGVSAPIGLILSDRVDSPAILGWLRPRILLPQAKAAEFSAGQLRHIFLHELVHFRAWDVQIGWLFALARCVHWFNPFAYRAEAAWTRFREEAADEQALRWTERQSYGETLVALVPVESSGIPGALALSETFPNLKHRIQLIMNNHLRKSRPLITLLGLVVLGLIAIQPTRAETDEKAAAVTAMETWLQGIDASKYAQSWKEAAPSFQKAVSEQQWVQALKGARAPAGKLLSRTLVSALHQTDIPTGSEVVKGDFVIAQFESSFENIKYAVETVTFEKDGESWKAAGYYIKPKL